MFIESIKIEKNNELVRNIKFKMGLNLILDETDTRKKRHLETMLARQLY